MEAISNKNLETIIRSQLKSLGYFSIEIKDAHDRTFNVIADGNKRKIFVKVMIKFDADNMPELTTEEITGIKYNASSIQKEPWTAIMNVNESGQLIDRIRWKNLSKMVL